MDVQTAAALFPEQFRLKGRTGTFRINQHASYVNRRGDVMLYVYAQNESNPTEWLAYAKGTVAELKQIIEEVADA